MRWCEQSAQVYVGLLSREAEYQRRGRKLKRRLVVAGRGKLIQRQMRRVLVLIVLVACVVASATDRLPSFSYAELEDPSADVLGRVSTALTELGALQIQGVPNFREARLAALEPLAQCLSKENESKSTRMVMSDGSPRVTIHAASKRGVASPFPSVCGDSAVALRAAIDQGTRRLLEALDKARLQKASSQLHPVDTMRPYASFQDIQRYGEHLEHLHAYFSPPASSSSRPKTESSLVPATVELHTDGGLLIAMTSGLYTFTGGAEQGPEEGLYLSLPSAGDNKNQPLLRVRSQDAQDNVVYLVGEAGSKWLAPVLGRPLRAVPHKLVASMSPDTGSTRAWYGKMYLPPADAVVAPASQSYAAVRLQVNRALSGRGNATATAPQKGSHSSSSLPAACGPDQYLTSSTQCTADDGTSGVYCWMTCMSVSSLDCGNTAVCYDSATSSVNNGNTMCQSTCSLKCPNWYVPEGADNGSGSASGAGNNGYCYGLGSIMVMEGFTSQALAGTAAPCMNYLFPAWTLSGPLKFGLACVGTFFLGILMHWVTKLRLAVGLWKDRQSVHRKACLCLLYLVNTMLGYFLMLLAMTYSTELFGMVLAGLTVGYGLFVVDRQVQPTSTDPCCGDEEVAVDRKGNGQGPSLNAILLGPSTHQLLDSSE